MKKSILAVAALLTISTGAIADDRWFSETLIMTEPELLISGGMSIGDTNNTGSIKFTVQEKLCYSTRICFNPSLMWLSTENDQNFSDGINIAAGLDAKYKLPKGRNNAIYVETGPSMFMTNVNGEHLKLHAGAGIEIRRYTLSIDSYGVGRPDPFYMVNIGYRL
ncbi:MAG: hypothetical protein K0U20_08615 [Proteobacteria bacterium]|nr:hypothetical protein [Pseudomonadota bacterium]